MVWRVGRCFCFLLVLAVLPQSRAASQSPSTYSDDPDGVVAPPRFIPFSGTLHDSSGKPIAETVQAMFSLYADQQGGPQLWSETQDLHPDANGHYAVQIGSSLTTGVPQEIFSRVEARWLGVSIAGGPEEPRVMLLSVPYALKAGDATTLGGLPPSAFLQAGAIGEPVTESSAKDAPSASGAATSQAQAAIEGQGTSGYLPAWTGANTIGDSIVYQSGSSIRVGTTVLEGDGISPVNVKAFGAKGDGVTNDTAAITAAIKAIPATGGVLYFPPGEYITTGGFTIVNPTEVVGAGEASEDQSQFGSMIVDTSPTSTLFTVTAKVGIFRDLALTNTSSSTPTSGAAVFTNSSYSTQRISFDSISVNGFYDDLHVGVGQAWWLRGSYIQNFVRYGVYIQNTAHPDYGDWIVSDNYFEGGSRTFSVTSTGGLTAGINIESSGGGKISGNKINDSFYDGIRLNATGSGQTLIDHNDIEGDVGYAIEIVQGWPYITIVGNYLNASSNQNPCIKANGLDGFYIGNNLLETYNTTAIPYAVVITNSQLGTIGPNAYNNHFTNRNSISGSYINDFSDPFSISQAGTATSSGSGTLTGLTIENPTNGNSGAGIILQDVFGGVTYTGSIVSSWFGNGMTFTAPRDLAGKGFYFNSNSGTTRLFINTATGKVQTTNSTLDDGSGNINIPAGKAFEINGTSIAPLAATTGSIGGAAIGAGKCTSGSAAVAGAKTTMAVIVAPGTYPGDGMSWNGYVSATGEVTVKVCSALGGTPSAGVYNVRVIP